MLRAIAASAVLLASLSGLGACQTMAPPTEPAMVILVGDSTMQARTGYGTQLCKRFGPPATCDNRSRGGTSTKSYRDIGSWDAAMKVVDDNKDKKTWVLIQLGHNDGSSLPARHTELPEYKANLARFVDEVRAHGATPVLISPVTDRWFKDGKPKGGMRPWATRTEEVAKEKGVAFVDLFEISLAYIGKIGITESDTLAPAPPPPSVVEASKTGTSGGWPVPKPAVDPAAPPAPAPTTPAPPGFDFVHIGAKGAPVFAGMVADELKKVAPELGRYVVPAS